MMKRIDVVCGVIYNKEGEIFIAKRKKGKHLECYWEFPGGKIDSEETHIEALSRELKEEFNMNVIVLKYMGNNIHQYPNFEVNLIAYKCLYQTSNLELIDHDEILWVNKTEITNYNLAPADIPFVKLV